MNKALIIGITCGIMLFFGLTALLPDVRCADGWLSYSIGKQGACSHHGGVDNNEIYRLLILGLSIFVGIKMYSYLNKRRKRYKFSSESFIYSAGIDSKEHDKWAYLVIGLFFSSFILFNKDAYPVLILGILFIIASIREFFRGS